MSDEPSTAVPAPKVTLPDPSAFQMRAYIASSLAAELVRKYTGDIIDSPWIADTAVTIADALLERLNKSTEPCQTKEQQQ